MAEDVQVLTIRLPAAIYERLRLMAFEQRKSMNALVTNWVVTGMEDADDATDADAAMAEGAFGPFSAIPPVLPDGPATGD